MKYENRTLCFFDILGFGDIVKKKTLDADQINQLFTEIDLIIKDYKNENDDNLQITHFSDSIVISIIRRNASPTQLKLIIEILIKLLEHRLIARGALVFGELVHTPNFIFGPALVKAASLEKTAEFPRIILDESLDENPLPTFGGSQITYSVYWNNFMYVKTDEGNIKYIDLIGEINKKSNAKDLFDILDHIINEGLQHKEEKVIKKYKWLRDKMNIINRIVESL